MNEHYTFVNNYTLINNTFCGICLVHFVPVFCKFIRKIFLRKSFFDCLFKILYFIILFSYRKSRDALIH